MVLSLKAWKSRSLPGLPRTEHPHHDISDQKPRGFPRGFFVSPTRHARARRGHPRLIIQATTKTWMAGTSPAMTVLRANDKL
jgi:hypothetical protein